MRGQRIASLILFYTKYVDSYNIVMRIVRPWRPYMSYFSGGNSSRRFGVCVCVCYDTKVYNDIILTCVVRFVGTLRISD